MTRVVNPDASLVLPSVVCHDASLLFTLSRASLVLTFSCAGAQRGGGAFEH